MSGSVLDVKDSSPHNSNSKIKIREEGQQVLICNNHCELHDIPISDHLKYFFHKLFFLSEKITKEYREKYLEKHLGIIKYIHYENEIFNVLINTYRLKKYKGEFLEMTFLYNVETFCLNAVRKYLWINTKTGYDIYVDYYQKFHNTTLNRSPFIYEVKREPLSMCNYDCYVHDCRSTDDAIDYIYHYMFAYSAKLPYEPKLFQKHSKIITQVKIEKLPDTLDNVINFCLAIDVKLFNECKSKFPKGSLLERIDKLDTSIQPFIRIQWNTITRTFVSFEFCDLFIENSKKLTK